MTLQEAIAAQPMWVQIWVNILFLGAFVLPLALLIWPASRRAAIVTVLASALAAAGIFWMFGKFGYVRLLGLPHVLIWTPIMIFLWGQSKRPDMPGKARIVMMIIMAVITVSLVFDYIDVARYILGDRAAF